ncbi:hypothetical protein BH18THE2_BH18THE2_40120 [soil metagenome]
MLYSEGTVGCIDKIESIAWSVYGILDAFDGHFDELSDEYDEQFYST